MPAGEAGGAFPGAGSTIRSSAKRAYLKILDASLFVNSRFYRGSGFSCPACNGKFRKMMPFKGHYYVRGVLVDHYTPNARCPRCRSEIRHRFILTFLKGKSGFLAEKIRLLHFAPEAFLSAYLSRQPNIEHVKCDIDPANFPGAIRADITDIPFDAGSFDAVICIHVLEHIEDDSRAIREIYRILRPGGWALVAIPVYGETTYEIKGLSYGEREKAYGTGQHMRMNGLDFVSRLSDAGFSVETVSFDDVPGDYIDRTVKTPHTESDRFLFWLTKSR